MLDLVSEGLVKLLGVAVQQRPWLCVIEFMKYGDLRDVLQTCKEVSPHNSRSMCHTSGRSLFVCVESCPPLHYHTLSSEALSRMFVLHTHTHTHTHMRTRTHTRTAQLYAVQVGAAQDRDADL
jgi:hypothetical protein